VLQHPSILETNNRRFPAMSIYKPYTYLIGWSNLNKYYYGVRYAKNCNPNDLWKTYFTSSDIIHEYVDKYGDPDIIQVRKTFDNHHDAREWESKVLKSLNCAADNRFLNKHNNTAFTPKYGEDNSSKRPEVRKKLSLSAKNRNNNTSSIKEGVEKMKNTKIKSNLIKFLKDISYIPKKIHITKIEKYIDYIISNYPKHFYTIKVLTNRLNLCKNIEKKPYPKNRKSGKRGTNPKISESKRGKKWYHNPITLETKPYKPGNEPYGWVLGMIKNTPTECSIETRKKLSKSMKIIRSSESEAQKSERLRKYHETIQNRRNNQH